MERTEFYEPGSLHPSWLPEPRGAGRRPVAPGGASLEERQARAAALEAARNAWLARQSRLHAAVEAASRETARIREQLEVARTRERGVELALVEGRVAHDAEVHGHERFLRETCDPLIDDILVWLRDQLDGLRARNVLVTTERDHGPLNWISLRRARGYFSNADSVEQRRLAIMAAMREWEGYRVMAIAATELRARAEALPSSLPAIDGSVAAPSQPILSPAEARELAGRAEEVGR